LARGHEVTAIVRHPEKITKQHPHLTVKQGDAQKVEVVAQLVAGHDVVVNSAAPNPENLPAFVELNRAVVDGLKQAGVARLLLVGGAGRLEVAPGVRLVDTDSFPAAWRPLAMTHIDSLPYYQQSGLEWTFISPAAWIEPGERTGKYRRGTNQFMTDAQGNSRISCEDYAIALLDEIEQPQAVGEAIAVAY
jgi:hypothetical protein